MQNVKINLVSRKSKAGKDYEALELVINLPKIGTQYKTLIFPTPIELAAIKDSLNQPNVIKDIYSNSENTLSESKGFFE